MVTAKERIDALVAYGGFKNVTALASALDLNGPQQIYDIRSGKTKSISAELADKIFLVFPELSKDWVLSGRGEMIRNGNVHVAGSNNGRIYSDDVNVQPEGVSISASDVKELISQNGKLIDIIKELTRK